MPDAPDRIDQYVILAGQRSLTRDKELGVYGASINVPAGSTINVMNYTEIAAGEEAWVDVVVTVPLEMGVEIGPEDEKAD